MWMLLQCVVSFVLNFIQLVVFYSNHMEVWLHLSGFIVWRFDSSSTHSRNGPTDLLQVRRTSVLPELLLLQTLIQVLIWSDLLWVKVLNFRKCCQIAFLSIPRLLFKKLLDSVILIDLCTSLEITRFYCLNF